MKVLACSIAFLIATSASAQKKDDNKKPKTVAGKADVLRHVKKHFAEFLGTDGGGKVRLKIEGRDGAESIWEMLPDADVRVHGWWGRVEQLAEGERVWVWFAVDRQKKPTAILMIADEISEQIIHGYPWTIQKIDGDSVTVGIPDDKKVKPRTLQKNGAEISEGAEFYLQTTGDKKIAAAMSAAVYEKNHATQRDWLRERWRTEGLPGGISFLHALSGEMEVMLDHEAMRWGRFLKNGDAVTMKIGPDHEVSATVKFTEPWRERTRIRLVTKSGMDQVDLLGGARILLKVPEPPAEVQAADYPTDISRLTEKNARVEWFLQSIYCPCGIANDRCTGMYYTLASCNENACGGPNEMREVLRAWIDDGMDDRAIYDRLKAERSADVARPHLLR